MPWIGFLGPDGTGKSTVIERLPAALPNEPISVKVHHWRPQVLFRKEFRGPVTEPHGRKPRSSGLSALALLVPVLDWWAGYWTQIFPDRMRGTLVVFDRFFADILVDPRRYRYAGPRWCPALLMHLLPQPSVVIVLEAPASVVYSRKQEIAPEEIERQRSDYRALESRFSNIHFVDAARPEEEVASDVATIVNAVLNGEILK
jgi:thymidylate kinase